MTLCRMCQLRPHKGRLGRMAARRQHIEQHKKNHRQRSDERVPDQPVYEPLPKKNKEPNI